MTMPLAAPYLISLCNAVVNSDLSLGVVGVRNSTFTLDAARLIKSIVTLSPASESVAIEFLFELEKLSGFGDLVAPVVRLRSESEPQQWAEEILALFRSFDENVLKTELQPVLDLATEYLNHLLIATRNPGRKKTPQDSTHPTPDVTRLQTIQDLLNEANFNRKQSALKKLVFHRDGHICPVTGLRFTEPRAVVARCAHIIPFSFRDKSLTMRALEAFTGKDITTELVQGKINDPCNAINLQTDAHESFHKLGWGIEAQEQPGGQWKYIFRAVGDYSGTVRLNDGDEIIFCQGENGQMIDPPKPSFCNLKLAIARVLHASGASGLIAELYGDDDDDEAILNQPVYLGGPLVDDDILFRRIHDRLPVT